MSRRDRWATRLGLILAMAGNAVGLGNFLRFPTQAARNGGGAFMLPYFVAFILVGIPLVWVEWTIGRHGGRYGHGSLPGAFDRMWSHPIAKYVGVLGIFIPLATVIFYAYVESWTLAFSFFSAAQWFEGVESRSGMGAFMRAFQGLEPNQHFSSLATAYVFFLITLAINVTVLSRGISRGIELLARVAMPVLFVFAIVLIVRVFTLGAPDPDLPERTALGGLAFVWNPDFPALAQPSVWLAAAGQVFFTLSVGAGHMHCYASYLREKDDLTLTSLTTASTNEFAEVILGGSLAIPVAFAFFGHQGTVDIANGGAYDLAFQAMPVIFGQIPLGPVFGCMWFLLLFFAGITSSVALSSPAMSFLEDELGFSRPRAALTVGLVVLVGGTLVALFLGQGFLDELDFWCGSLLLVVLALIEVIVFAWIFGLDRAWTEMHKGALLRVPRVFYYVIKYVTPAFLLILLITWFVQDGLGYLLMSGVSDARPDEVWGRWGARGLMLVLFVTIAWLTGKSFARKGKP